MWSCQREPAAHGNDGWLNGGPETSLQHLLSFAPKKYRVPEVEWPTEGGTPLFFAAGSSPHTALWEHRAHIVPGNPAQVSASSHTHPESRQRLLTATTLRVLPPCLARDTRPEGGPCSRNYSNFTDDYSDKVDGLETVVGNPTLKAT